MTVAGRLASALGRRDEAPNIALAEELARSEDSAAIGELAALADNGTRAQRQDAIKTLYELAERRPALAMPHLDLFLSLLASKDNSMVWGTMSALAALAPCAPDRIMSNLDTIIGAADEGTVISRDKCMVILAALNRVERFRAIVTPVILARLRYAATNQTPMYAEITAPTIAPADRDGFAAILRQRLTEIPHPAKRKRLEKVLRQYC